MNWCPRCGTAISDLEVAYRGHARHAQLRALRRGRGRQRDHRDDASGDDARRHGRGRASRRRAVHGTCRQDGRSAAAAGPGAHDRRRDDRVDPRSAPGCQDHAGDHDPNDFRQGSARLPAIKPPRPRRPLQRDGRALRRPRTVEQVAEAGGCGSGSAVGLVIKVEPTPEPGGDLGPERTPIEPYLSDQWFVRHGRAGQEAGHGRGPRVPGQDHAGALGPRYLDWIGDNRGRGASAGSSGGGTSCRCGTARTVT